MGIGSQPFVRFSFVSQGSKSKSIMLTICVDFFRTNPMLTNKTISSSRQNLSFQRGKGEKRYCILLHIKM